MKTSKEVVQGLRRFHPQDRWVQTGPLKEKKEGKQGRKQEFRLGGQGRLLGGGDI